MKAGHWVPSTQIAPSRETIKLKELQADSKTEVLGLLQRYWPCALGSCAALPLWPVPFQFSVAKPTLTNYRWQACVRSCPANRLD